LIWINRGWSVAWQFAAERITLTPGACEERPGHDSRGPRRRMVCACGGFVEDRAPRGEQPSQDNGENQIHHYRVVLAAAISGLVEVAGRTLVPLFDAET
jgi:hypothetical protein